MQGLQVTLISWNFKKQVSVSTAWAHYTLSTPMKHMQVNPMLSTKMTIPIKSLQLYKTPFPII